MVAASHAPVGLTPGKIYSAETLLGYGGPLGGESEAPLSERLRSGLGRGALSGPLFASDGSGDASSISSSSLSSQQLMSQHSSVESVWGSASEAPNLQQRMQRRPLGLRQDKLILSDEISAAALARECEANSIKSKTQLHLYLQKQAVEPPRAPITAAAAAAAAGGEEASREEAIRQAEEQAAAAAAAAAGGAGGGRFDSASITSTLVLNTKTKRLERKGKKELALIRKRQEGQQAMTQEETEKMCILFEAFQRGCTDTSGWLKTSDFAWALQRDPRLLEIFGLKQKSKKNQEETGWGRWLTAIFRNRDDPIPLDSGSQRKMRALLNQIRRIESDLVSNERASHDLKMTFETFAAGFLKFLGDSDPAVWSSTEPSFVEIATEKEPPYGMSLTEMLVRDSLLGVSLTKTEAWQPDKVQFGGVRLLELPGASLLQRGRDRAEQQRAAEAKFRAQLLQNGDHHKLAARVRAEAERAELELLQKATKEELQRREWLTEDQQLQQRLRQLSEGPLEWHLRPLPRFTNHETATAAVAAAAGAAAAAAGLRAAAAAGKGMLAPSPTAAASLLRPELGGLVVGAKERSSRAAGSRLSSRNSSRTGFPSQQQQQQQQQQEEGEELVSRRSSASSLQLQSVAAVRRPQ
ncbi:hypothetical protein Emag_001538 [Eimeria magna]